MGGHHFHENGGMSFLMKVPLSLKMGRDDENRLMSRVLPRPQVLQGGKSSRKNTEKHEGKIVNFYN